MYGGKSKEVLVGEVDILCITIGLFIALIFFGVGVVFGRISKDTLHGHTDMGVNSNRDINLCDCMVGDDLK